MTKNYLEHGMFSEAMLKLLFFPDHTRTLVSSNMIRLPDYLLSFFVSGTHFSKPFELVVVSVDRIVLTI